MILNRFEKQFLKYGIIPKTESEFVGRMIAGEKFEDIFNGEILEVVFKDGRKEKAIMQSNGYLMFEEGTELNMYELEAVGGRVEAGNKYTSIEEYNDIYTTGGTGKGSRKVCKTYTIKFRDSDKKIIFNFEFKGKIAELRKYINANNFKVFKNN